MTADAPDDRDEPLTPTERSALARLKRDQQPPAGLEARVLQAVGAGSSAKTGTARWRVPALSALAASLTFALGTWVGSTWTGPRSSTPTGAKFMLLLYEDASFQPAADPSSRVREYSAWARTLARASQLVAGDELDDAGVGLTSTSTALAVGADDARAQPRGYFVIVAKDSAAALAIASTCPHLKYGGRIVIRKILT